MFNGYTISSINDEIDMIDTTRVCTCGSTKFAFILNKKICRSCGKEVDNFNVFDMSFNESGKNVTTVISREYLPEISSNIIYNYVGNKRFQIYSNVEKKITLIQKKLFSLCGARLPKSTILLAIKFMVSIYASGFIKRGRNKTLIPIGSVYYASIQTQIPIIIKDLMTMFSVQRVNVTFGINKFIKFSKKHKIDHDIKMFGFDIDAMIKRFLAEILNMKSYEKVRKRLDTYLYKQKVISGNIITFIVSLIYSVLLDDSLDKLSEISGYSAITILNKVSKIQKVIN